MVELDDYFKAREIIIPGSVETPVREQPGSNITFTRLGSGAQLSKREAHIAEIQSVSHPAETALRVLRVVATVHLEGYNQG